MADPFIWERRVGFGDCDPTRIAYTGRIADFALEALDAFWDDLLDGESWYQMNVDCGYPTCTGKAKTSGGDRPTITKPRRRTRA